VRSDKIINNNIKMPKSCPAGKIKRNGYTTERGTKVATTCTKNMSTPGKTPSNKKVLPKLKEGYLSKYGYSFSKNDTKRETSLRKAMKNEGDLEVLRRVVLLRTYMKNEPLKFQKLDKDVKYIQKLIQENKEKQSKTKSKKYTRKPVRKSALKKTKTKKKKTVKKVKKVRFKI